MLSYELFEEQEMFTPRYNMTFDIQYSLEEIERIKYRIEHQLIMPKHEEWLRREAFIRTVYSSTITRKMKTTPNQIHQ